MSLLWAWVDGLEEVDEIELASEEARHVAARRLRAGDPLVLFDGQGRTAPARIEAISKRSVRVVPEAVEVHARPDDRFVLASAIPKGERLSILLQMTSQLGLSRWQPLILEDSAIRKLDPSASRLRRILIESCKVSRRPWALEVEAACGLEQALARHGTQGGVAFGDRDGASWGLAAGTGLVLIGPEAGFSEAERAVLGAAGAEPRVLGPYNMRIETAAIAAVATFGVARSNRQESLGAGPEPAGDANG